MGIKSWGRLFPSLHKFHDFRDLVWLSLPGPIDFFVHENPSLSKARINSPGLIIGILASFIPLPRPISIRSLQGTYRLYAQRGSCISTVAISDPGSKGISVLSISSAPILKRFWGRIFILDFLVSLGCLVCLVYLVFLVEDVESMNTYFKDYIPS